MRFLALLLMFSLLLCGCSHSAPELSAPPASDTHPYSEPVPTDTTAPAATEPAPDPIDLLIASMSLEERVGQLFLARCNAATASDDISKYHLGGLVLFAVDFQDQTPQTMQAVLSGYQSSAKIPLLISVDEEGGTVTRISRYSAFRSGKFPSIREAFDNGGLDGLLSVEAEKCQLLGSLGINVNLGPVCDIALDPSAFMYSRSLGQSPTVTARYVSDTVALMSSCGIGSVLKHFPGYGNNVDTHVGIAVDSRSLEELESFDLIPFRSGITAGCGAIMVSHTVVEALDPDFPASLSPAVHRYLRETMDFSGVILTDDLVMQAITDRYGAGEAAVMAVLAGNDLLCSSEYVLQYEAVLAAVMEGRIDIDTLNSAVRHVLQWKTEIGLI